MKPIERIKRARALLLLDEPFFGTLAIRLELVEDPDIETAATNGKRLRFNPQWIESLSDAELKGVVAHEVLHNANGHTWRRGSRDKAQWNMAGDYAINHVLVQAGFTLPKDALLDPTYEASAEEVYAKLSKPQQGGQGDPQPNGGSRQGSGQPDVNEPSEDSPGPSEAEQGQGSRNPRTSPPDSPGNKPQGTPETGCEDPTIPSDPTVADPGMCGAVEDPPEGEKDLTKAEWKVAVAQAVLLSQGRGTLPGDLVRMVDQILHPTVPWEVLLRDFVERTARNDYDWRRPSRRYAGRGVVLPSLISEELPEVVVAVDTSGSISVSNLNKFAAEASAILGAYETTIHLIYVDARVQGTETLTRADLPFKLNPSGGGGTDFRPAFDWVEQQDLTPACLIYLTDLDGPFPAVEPAYPVLWVTTSKGRKGPFGETVELEEGQ